MRGPRAPAGPAGQKGAVAAPVRVGFTRLWQSYPNSHPCVDPKTGDDPPGFDKQCATSSKATRITFWEIR